LARAWRLASRPQGLPTPANFELADIESAPLKEGQVRVRNRWLTADPATRTLMNKVEGQSVPAMDLHQPMYGHAMGEVVESLADGFAVGDKVIHTMGWREEAVAKGKAFAKVPTVAGVPDQMWLGALGMTGATAYFGLLDVGEAKEGETLFVSAAAGAVGSTVVQIARLKGMKVIGSAGGAQKCALVRELGADITIDYKAPGLLAEKLKEAAPKGIDVYFDNVGGDHLDAALSCAREGARFAECGMIGGYNVEDAHGAVTLRHLMQLIAARVRMRGFVVHDYMNRMNEFQKDMIGWVADGRIKGTETVYEGLETLPNAFIGLFTGSNAGKTLVKL